MILGIVTVFSLPSHSAANDIERVQKAYEGIKDISGSFIQKSTIRDLKRTDTYKGQFTIKAQKVRWEYRGDNPQVIYMNGEDMLIYQKKEKQAFRSKFDRATYGQAPLALLGGFGDLRKEFDVTPGNGRLTLKPKGPMGTISQVDLALGPDDSFPVEAFVIVDTHGNRTEIQLRNVKINTGVKDSFFEFKVPEGVRVITQ